MAQSLKKLLFMSYLEALFMLMTMFMIMTPRLAMTIMRPAENPSTMYCWFIYNTHTYVLGLGLGRISDSAGLSGRISDIRQDKAGLSRIFGKICRIIWYPVRKHRSGQPQLGLLDLTYRQTSKVSNIHQQQDSIQERANFYMYVQKQPPLVLFVLYIS